MKLDDVKHFFECMQTYQKHTKKTRFTVDILPEAVEEMIRVIDEAKTVEPKRGRWIEQEGFDGDVYYTCSVCNCDWVCIDGSPQENNMRYCPECGAAMTEGGETDA